MKIRSSILVRLSFLLPGCLAVALSLPAAGASELEPARDLFLKGEIEEAIAGFLDCPESEEASYWLVRAYLNRNEVSKAVEKAREMHARDSGSAIALAAMGDVEYRQGHFEASAEYYRKAVAAGREFPRAYLGLGRILESEKRLKSARECFEKAFAIDPDDPDIMREKARYQSPSPEEQALWLRYIASAGYEDPAYLANLNSWLERRTAWEGISLRRLRSVPEHAAIKLIHFYDGMRYNRYGLKVRINGRKTARLLLDSGASGILVSRKFAESARVPLFGQEKTRGFGEEGDRETQIGLADTVEIGDLVFENYPVNFAGKDTVLAEDGIIGTEVFSRFLITLDFNKNRLLLDRLPDPPGVGETDSYSVYDFDWEPGPERKDYHSFRFIHGKVLVPSLVNGEEEVHLIFDTGASYNIFSHSLADKVEYTRLENRTLTGVSGRIDDIRKVDEVRIGLAGIEQVSHLTMAFDLDGISRILGTEIGGLIGYPFLLRCVISIDYRTGSIRIIPDPHRRD